MKPHRAYSSSCLIMALCTQALAAAPCDPSLHPETTLATRFTAGPDGTVIDNNTGLTWMRCALGQQWSDKSCVGSAAHYAWADADWAKDTLNLNGYAGYTDWRIPVLPELASLVETGCVSPASMRINTTVFPATPGGVFWSSMQKPGTDGYAYTLDFGGGGAAATLKTSSGAVRLVRGGPWWTPPEKTVAQKQSNN